MSGTSEALATAQLYHQSGDLLRAERMYRQVLQADAENAEALNSLGLLELQRGRVSEACELISRAIALDESNATFYNHLGVAYSTLGQQERALESFRRAIELDPDFPVTYYNLGNALTKLNELDEAIANYQRAIRLRPNYAEAHYNLGNRFRDQNKFAEAIASYEKAVSIRREYGKARRSLAQAHLNWGVSFHKQGNLNDAIARYKQAIGIRPHYPEAHLDLGMALLSLGDYEQGWSEYEWRWKCKALAVEEFPYPRWDGTPLEGRIILIRAEQGFGDSLQFIRYAPMVKQRGGSVIFQCQKPLVHILRGCPGTDRIIAQGDPLPQFDVYAPLMSLPGIFRTTPETVPADIPYLDADEQLCERWRRVLNEQNGLRVGIAWQTNPVHDSSPYIHQKRSFPLVELEPLARLSGVNMISLQKSHGTEQLAEVADRFTVKELGPDFDQASGAFIDTAAVMKCLDLVICCDSAVAHLAGALGVPVWLALPFASEWRWMQGRQDTLWYPGHRLFRQPRPGDWEAVFNQMRAELETKLRAWRPTGPDC